MKSEILNCQKCNRLIMIESMYISENSNGEPVIARNPHSTVTGSKIQCACGHLL